MISKIYKTGKNIISALLVSPEQRQRVEEKKVGVMQNVQHNLTVSLNIGPTWKEALEAEFSKEYYIKVSNAFSRCTQ